MVKDRNIYAERAINEDRNKSGERAIIRDRNTSRERFTGGGIPLTRIQKNDAAHHLRQVMPARCQRVSLYNVG